MGRSSLGRLFVATLAGATIAGCNALLIHYEDGYSGTGATSSTGGTGGTGGQPTSSSSSSSGSGGGGTGGTGGTIETGGLPVWATALGVSDSTSTVTVTGMGVDDSGTAYLTGSFSGDLVAAGCQTLTAPPGVVMGYLVKLSGAGACQWSTAFGASSAPDGGPGPVARGTAVAVAPTGEVTLAGTFDTAISGPGVPAFMAPAGVDAFVIRYPNTFDPAVGFPTWALRIGDLGDQSITRLALDGGKVYAFGTFKETLKSIPPSALALSSASPNAVGVTFLLDETGVPVTGASQTLTGATGDVAVSGGAFAGDGGTVSLAGSLSGGITDCSGLKAEVDGVEAIVGRYTVGLGCLSAVWLAQTGDQRAEDVVFSVNGDMYAAGVFTDGIDFSNGHSLLGSSTPSVFLVRADPSGAALKAVGFGDFNPGSSSVGVRLAVDDTTRDIVFAGTLSGPSALLGKQATSPPGGANIVVGRVDFALDNAKWLRVYGTNKVEGADAVAITKAGDIVIAGHFSNTLDFGSGTTPLSSMGSGVFVAKLTP
jgi:hypothetical protein